MMDKILRVVLIFGIVISSVYLYYKCTDLIDTFEDTNINTNEQQNVENTGDVEDIETNNANTLDDMTVDKIRSLVEGNVKNVLQALFSNLNSENLTLSSIANDIQHKSDPVVSIGTMLESMKQYISGELWINKRRDVKLRNKLQKVLDTDVNNLKSKMTTYIQDYENNNTTDATVNMAIQYICNEMVSVFAKSMRDMYKVVVDWHESQINKYNKNTISFSKLEAQLDKEYTEYYKYEEFLDSYIYITNELKKNNTNNTTNMNESVKSLPIEYNLNENRVRFSDKHLDNFLNAYVTVSNSLLMERYNS